MKDPLDTTIKCDHIHKGNIFKWHRHVISIYINSLPKIEMGEIESIWNDIEKCFEDSEPFNSYIYSNVTVKYKCEKCGKICLDNEAIVIVYSNDNMNEIRAITGPPGKWHYKWNSKLPLIFL